MNRICKSCGSEDLRHLKRSCRNYDGFEGRWIDLYQCNRCDFQCVYAEDEKPRFNHYHIRRAEVLDNTV